MMLMEVALRVDETSELYSLDEGVADLKLAAEMGNADARNARYSPHRRLH